MYRLCGIRRYVLDWRWVAAAKNYFAFREAGGNLKSNNSLCDTPKASARCSTVEIVVFVIPLSILESVPYSISASRAN